MTTSAPSEGTSSDHESGQDSPPGRASRRRGWPVPLSILLALIGSAVGGLLGYRAVPPLYQSRGLIGINPVVSKMMYETEQSAVMPVFDAFISTQIELIRSERVILRAMQDEDWQARRPNMTPDQQQDFKDNLEVLRPARANIVIVRFNDKDPEAARIAVRSVINSYKRLFVEADENRDIERLQQLDIRRTNLTNKLKALRKQIHTVSQEMGPDAQHQMYGWQLVKLNELEDSIRHTEALLANPDKAAEGGVPSVTALAKTDLYLAALLSQRDALHRQLGLHEVTNPGHRPITEATAGLESVEQSIKTYVQHRFGPSPLSINPAGRPGISTTRLTLAQLNERFNRLKDMKTKAVQSLRKMSDRIVRIENLELEAMEFQKRMMSTTYRIDALNVESKVSGRIEIITDGERPLTPVNAGSRKQMTILGGAAGFILPLLAIFGIARIAPSRRE